MEFRPRSEVGARPSRARRAPTLSTRCLEILRQGLRSSSLGPVCHAAEALSEIGCAHEVHDAMLAGLASAANDHQRCVYARELARAGDSSHLATILQVLVQGTVRHRTIAAECLFKIRHVGDLPALQQLAVHEDPQAQLMSSAALIAQGEIEHFDRIRSLLAHEDPTVRKIAAWLLTRLGDSSDVAPMRQHCAGERDGVALAYMHHALAALGDEAGVAALRANMSADSVEVRQMAADTARLIDGCVQWPELMRSLADADEDVRVRAAHAFLFHGHGDRS